MNPVDWPTLLAIAPSIAIAVAFGFFILRLLDRQDKQTDKRDGEWRSFLGDTRNDYTNALSNVVGEIKTLTDVVRSTYQIVIEHDKWERASSVSEHQERASAITASADAVKTAADVVARALVVADAKREAERAREK